MLALKIGRAALLLAGVLGTAGVRRSDPSYDSAAARAARSQPGPGQSTFQSSQCVPLETRPPEAPDYQPSFPGQTRACGVRSNVAFDVTVVARGLGRLWAVEPLPGGGLLVSEKAGQMRLVSASGEVGAPIAGVPAVDDRAYGGLLDVALSPSFDADRTVYWAFTEPRETGNGLSIARGVLAADGTRLDQVRVILRTMPTYANNMNYGGRLAFGPDGMLYVTVSERFDPATRTQAQQLDSHLGKVLRIQPDGSPAPGNPFADHAGAFPEIWSLGHRSIQGATFDPQGRLWTVEHGPRGGDELNLMESGKNYGWPLVTYGIDYRGAPMEGAVPRRAGFEPPVYYWSPVIAPSSMEVYTGDAFTAWRGSLFIGGLVSTRLVRLVIENDRVMGEEHLLVDRGQRIRDVRQGPDGALYVVTDGQESELWRIAPSAQESTMKIRIDIEGTPIMATLGDNETARDFASLLPLTLTLTDYAATEKISDLPRRLSTAGAPRGVDPSIGDIAYYAPWGNLAVFYRDFGYSAGLVKLGTIDAGIEALSRPGPLRATIELIEE
jgi:glucose/arabinose dehydrogenase